PEPKGYTIETPARIALDLPGVVSKLDTKYHSLGIGNAREVTVIEAKDRTRVIVNLDRLVAYETRIEDNTLFLTVGANAAEGIPTPTRGGSAPAQISNAVSKIQGESEITGVDFRRGEAGEGKVIVTLSNPKAPVDITSESGKIKVVVRNTTLPTE